MTVLARPTPLEIAAGAARKKTQHGLGIHGLPVVIEVAVEMVLRGCNDEVSRLYCPGAQRDRLHIAGAT